ncbi:hypothetical protein ACFO3U_03885 [Flavobacterium ponti]|uniref:Uncharacterized protein n=1 Tax=Flavobacterium ponti TaxID=665133 RepID=A0ABV9P414_9FLAO
MKKVVLSLALVAMMFVSCKETEANTEEATTDAVEAVEATAEEAVETVEVAADSATAAVEAAGTEAAAKVEEAAK